MANQASNKIKYLLATGAIDFESDTFKIILMEEGFTFDRDNHETYADVSGNELPDGNGYTVGGETLTGVTVTENDTSDRCEVEWDNVQWTASGGAIGPSRGAIIYDSTHVDDAVVGFIDFGSNYTQPDGGVATITDVEVRIS